MADLVRVLRMLEYVGPRDWLERTLAQGAVPTQGEHRITLKNGPAVIRSGLVGTYPEVLEPLEQDPDVTYKLWYVLKHFSEHIEEGVFTFPDGDSWDLMSNECPEDLRRTHTVGRFIKPDAS